VPYGLTYSARTVGIEHCLNVSHVCITVCEELNDDDDDDDDRYLAFGARGFRSAAPTIWNSLPSHVRSCETLTTFRRHLKAHFFHSALPTA